MVDFKPSFEDIAIHEAANDRRLRGSLEWLHLGDTFEVSQGFLEHIEQDEILDDIMARYNLTREQAEKAEALCENQILGVRKDV